MEQVKGVPLMNIGSACIHSMCTCRSDNSFSVPPSPSQLEIDDATQPPRKRRKSPHELDDVLIRHLQERAEDRKKRQEENEDDHFGWHVAGVLKRLPNRTKAMARMQIEQVLMHAEFPETPSYSSSPYDHYPC